MCGYFRVSMNQSVLSQNRWNEKRAVSLLLRSVLFKEFYNSDKSIVDSSAVVILNFINY